MSLLDTMIDTVQGKPGREGEAQPVINMLGTLLTQSGGIQGLMNRFSQAGFGNLFSSWIGTGENKAITGDQIQQVLGCEPVKALATKLGIDPAQASELIAQYLPKTIDKLTPAGKIDPSVTPQQGLATLLPSLIQQFAGKK